jgi:hypothetical protein
LTINKVRGFKERKQQRILSKYSAAILTINNVGGIK